MDMFLMAVRFLGTVAQIKEKTHKIFFFFSLRKIASSRQCEDGQPLLPLLGIRRKHRIVFHKING